MFALVRAAALGLLAAALAAPAGAQPVEWKFSHWAAPTHPLHRLFSDWARGLEQRSQGALRLSVFPAQQLGKTADHYEMVTKGIAEAALIPFGHQAGRMLASSAAHLPWMIADPVAGTAAVDEWYRPLATRDMPGVRLCLVVVPEVGGLHARSEIRTPEQLRGLRVRPAHATVNHWLSTLGTSTVQVSVSETREALERGVADAVTMSWGTLVNARLDAAVTHHLDEPMFAAGYAVVLNLERLQALPPTLRRVLDEACAAPAAVRIAREWAQWAQEGRQKLLAAGTGHTVVRLRPEERAAWKRSGDAVVKAWAEDMRRAGQDPDKVLGDLRQALLRHQASVP